MCCQNRRRPARNQGLSKGETRTDGLTRGTAACVSAARERRNRGCEEPRDGMMRDFPAIEDHGVVGDLHTVALVCKDGTIDFMCAPRFDSPPVFASLLDRGRGGSFALAPALDGARLKQLYLPDTNVLLTRFLSADGVAEISDFMPVGETERVRCLVRRVKAVRGDIAFRMRCAPRFGYGPAAHRVTGDDGHALFLPDGGDVAARLLSTQGLTLHEGAAVAEFTLPQGKTATF